MSLQRAAQQTADRVVNIIGIGGHYDRNHHLKTRQLRELVNFLFADYQVSVRRACRVVCMARSNCRYRPHRREDRHVRQRIREIAAARVRYGMWRIYVLLRREGWKDNHKRIHRIYRRRA